MKVKCWGTRGGVATPSLKTVELGGNTPCIQIKLTPEKSIVIDSGTGIIEYASSGVDLSVEKEFHVLITHFHWDHIIGFPFFHVIHAPQVKVNLYSPFDTDILCKHMSSLFDGTYSPLKNISNLNASIRFHQIPEEGVEINGAKVTYCQTNHPEECYAYKIEYDNQSLAYVTDHENDGQEINEKIIEFAKSADLLFHDAEYTSEMYLKHHQGWGHSSIDKAIDNAEKARVKKLLLFHHSTNHSDDDLRLYLFRLKKKKQSTSGPIIQFASERILYDVGE